MNSFRPGVHATAYHRPWFCPNMRQCRALALRLHTATGCLSMIGTSLRVPRGVATAFLALFASLHVAIATAATAHAKDPAVRFMQAAANELIQAQRQGTQAAFRRVVNKYGHISQIGLDALGNYKYGLKRQDRGSYFRGIVRFIARYAANEAPKYPVSRVSFRPTAARDGRGILVDSIVYLRDGSAYDVRWTLLPNRRSFKIREAEVNVPLMGNVKVSPFLHSLFQNYIAENGGRVSNLVMALNR